MSPQGYSFSSLLQEENMSDVISAFQSGPQQRMWKKPWENAEKESRITLAFCTIIRIFASSFPHKSVVIEQLFPHKSVAIEQLFPHKSVTIEQLCPHKSVEDEENYL